MNQALTSKMQENTLNLLMSSQTIVYKYCFKKPPLRHF